MMKLFQKGSLVFQTSVRKLCATTHEATNNYIKNNTNKTNHQLISSCSISLMEEQEEEEEEQSDDENEEAEAMPRRRIGWRQLNKKGRRSLPLADERRTESRSRSPNQQQQRQRPVPSSKSEQQNSSNILWDLFYADSAEIPRQFWPSSLSQIFLLFLQDNTCQ
jgi:hypothetical protein